MSNCDGTIKEPLTCQNGRRGPAFTLPGLRLPCCWHAGAKGSAGASRAERSSRNNVAHQTACCGGMKRALISADFSRDYTSTQGTSMSLLTASLRVLLLTSIVSSVSGKLITNQPGQMLFKYGRLIVPKMRGKMQDYCSEKAWCPMIGRLLCTLIKHR